VKEIMTKSPKSSPERHSLKHFQLPAEMRILTNFNGAENAIASFLKAQQDRGASPVHAVNQKKSG
jgi:hypothetical protein